MACDHNCGSSFGGRGFDSGSDYGGEGSGVGYASSHDGWAHSDEGSALCDVPEPAADVDHLTALREETGLISAVWLPAARAAGASSEINHLLGVVDREPLCAFVAQLLDMLQRWCRTEAEWAAFTSAWEVHCDEPDDETAWPPNSAVAALAVLLDRIESMTADERLAFSFIKPDTHTLEWETVVESTCVAAEADMAEAEGEACAAAAAAVATDKRRAKKQLKNRKDKQRAAAKAAGSSAAGGEGDNSSKHNSGLLGVSVGEDNAVKNFDATLAPPVSLPPSSPSQPRAVAAATSGLPALELPVHDGSSSSSNGVLNEFSVAAETVSVAAHLPPGPAETVTVVTSRPGTTEPRSYGVHSSLTGPKFLTSHAHTQ